MSPTNWTFWAVWGVVLLAQNFSFTLVSRARNSGSLARHMKAAVLSNGIWFSSQILATSAFLDILAGKHGWSLAVFGGLFYTALTVGGSVLAHYHSLRTEKGHKAVGANARYVQITKEEWAAVQSAIKVAA